MTFEQEKEVSNIVYFLDRNYSVEVILPYAHKKLDSLYKKDKDPESTRIMNSLCFQYRSKYDQKDDKDNSFNYYFYEDDDNVVNNIHGYDFIFNLSQSNDFESSTIIDNVAYSIKAKATDYGHDLQINKDIIPLKINDFIDSNPGFSYDDRNKKIEQKIKDSKYTILITYITANGIIEKKKKVLENYQINVMVGIKK